MDAPLMTYEEFKERSKQESFASKSRKVDLSHHISP